MEERCRDRGIMRERYMREGKKWKGRVEKEVEEQKLSLRTFEKGHTETF